MRAISKFADAPVSQGLFELANLSPERTGLPLMVWISTQAGAQHDVRLKVSFRAKVPSSDVFLKSGSS